MTKEKDAADSTSLAFSGYPITRAAKHYSEHVKPALRLVARELGYVVGRYVGHGHPSTRLVASEDSPIAHIDLDWRYDHGNMRVVANLRTKQTREFNRTGFGQIVNAMSWGVGDATGYSDKDARSLRDVVTSAVRAAEAALEERNAKEAKPCDATK